MDDFDNDYWRDQDRTDREAVNWDQEYAEYEEYLDWLDDEYLAELAEQEYLNWLDESYD